MKITKRQLKRIIKEEVQILREQLEDDPADPMGGSWDAPLMGDEEDKSVEVWEAIQQNVEEPSFAEFLGKELETGPDPEIIMDAVQQNLNDPKFVDWLYKELSLDGYL